MANLGKYFTGAVAGLAIAGTTMFSPNVANAAGIKGDTIGNAIAIDFRSKSQETQGIAGQFYASKLESIILVANGGTVEEIANIRLAASEAEKILGKNIVILHGNDYKPDDNKLEVYVHRSGLTPNVWDANKFKDELVSEQIVAAVKYTGQTASLTKEPAPES